MQNYTYAPGHRLHMQWYDSVIVWATIELAMQD